MGVGEVLRDRSEGTNGIKRIKVDGEWIAQVPENVLKVLLERSEKNSDYWLENDTLHKSVEYLYEQNKRYREALEFYEKGRFGGVARKALEGES